MSANIDLAAVTAEAVRMKDRIILEAGEEAASVILRVIRNEMDQAIAECDLAVGIRSVFAKRCAAELGDPVISNVVPLRQRKHSKG